MEDILAQLAQQGGKPPIEVPGQPVTLDGLVQMLIESGVGSTPDSPGMMPLPVIEPPANLIGQITAPRKPESSESPVGARFWAAQYNADEAVPLKTRISQYENAQEIKTTKAVKTSAEHAVDSGAFDNEFKDLGVNKNVIKEGLINLSKIETIGGQLAKNKQISSTGARGLFQIAEGTAQSVLKHGQIGPKAAKAMGKTVKELKGLSRRELQNLLLNDDKANAIFATAVIVQKLQHAKNQ